MGSVNLLRPITLDQKIALSTLESGHSDIMTEALMRPRSCRGDCLPLSLVISTAHKMTSQLYCLPGSLEL